MNTSQQIQNLSASQALKSLGSGPNGLAAGEAADRLREVGRNSVEVHDPWRLLRSLMRQFTNFFTMLLFASAAICFVAEHLQPGQSMNVLGWALGGVAMLNALFSFVQEYRAEKAMAALRQFLPQRVEVLRNGRADNLARRGTGARRSAAAQGRRPGTGRCPPGQDRGVDGQQRPAHR